MCLPCGQIEKRLKCNTIKTVAMDKVINMTLSRLNTSLLVGVFGIILFLFVPSAQAINNYYDQLPADLRKPTGRVDSGDIYRQVYAINILLDQFLKAMGQTKKKHPELIIANVQPRELLFQAKALYAQTSRLSFEYTRKSESPISRANIRNVKLRDIWIIVHESLVTLYNLRPVLDVVEPVKVPKIIERKTLTEVYQQILDVNEKLDDLAWFEYSPSESYQVVTQAIYFASALIQFSPNPKPIPEAPGFIRGQTSADAYKQLLKIMKNIDQIAKISGIPTLTLTDKDLTSVRPVDVYNLANLVLSELQYIFDLAGGNENKVPVSYYPGWKFPSHVNQRIGVLSQQVDQLLKTVKDNPSWILKGRRS